MSRGWGDLVGGGNTVSVDITQPEGVWVLAVVCESSDGSPLELELLQDGEPIDDPLELPCADASGTVDGGGVSQVAYDGEVETTMRLTTTSADAVFVHRSTPAVEAETD